MPRTKAYAARLARMLRPVVTSSRDVEATSRTHKRRKSDSGRSPSAPPAVGVKLLPIMEMRAVGSRMRLHSVSAKASSGASGRVCGSAFSFLRKDNDGVTSDADSSSDCLSDSDFVRHPEPPSAPSSEAELTDADSGAVERISYEKQYNNELARAVREHNGTDEYDDEICEYARVSLSERSSSTEYSDEDSCSDWSDDSAR